MNRAKDWLLQAERDLEMAGIARKVGRHEWACFAAQQAAGQPVGLLWKAVEALHLGQEAWGHVVARLLKELPSWQRSLGLPLEELPVPAEALVYTLAEWQALPERSPRLAQTLRRETRWLLHHPAPSP